MKYNIKFNITDTPTEVLRELKQKGDYIEIADIQEYGDIVEVEIYVLDDEVIYNEDY